MTQDAYELPRRLAKRWDEIKKGVEYEGHEGRDEW